MTLLRRPRPPKPLSGFPVCTMPDCDSRAEYVTAGLCRKHYNGMRQQKRVVGSPQAQIREFNRLVEPGENGCWQWVGHIEPHGYGKAGFGPWAHRWSFELHVGPIPSGLHLDHLCRNRSCVNPEHLEPVTPWINTMRSASLSAKRFRATECVNDHPYDEENTYWRPLRNGHRGRGCRICRAAADRRRHERKMAARREVAA